MSVSLDAHFPPHLRKGIQSICSDHHCWDLQAQLRYLCPQKWDPPTVIFPCPHMHSQKSEFPNPAISMLLHRYKWWPQSSLHLPLIRWPQIGGREWTLLSQGCSATKDKTSGVWERYSRKAQLGSLRGQKQTNGLSPVLGTKLHLPLVISSCFWAGNKREGRKRSVPSFNLSLLWCLTI